MQMQKVNMGGACVSVCGVHFSACRHELVDSCRVIWEMMGTCGNTCKRHKMVDDGECSADKICSGKWETNKESIRKLRPPPETSTGCQNSVVCHRIISFMVYVRMTRWSMMVSSVASSWSPRGRQSLDASPTAARMQLGPATLDGMFPISCISGGVPSKSSILLVFVDGRTPSK